MQESYSYKPNVSDWISPCECPTASVGCHISQQSLLVLQDSFQQHLCGGAPSQLGHAHTGCSTVEHTEAVAFPQPPTPYLTQNLWCRGWPSNNSLRSTTVIIFCTRWGNWNLRRRRVKYKPNSEDKTQSQVEGMMVCYDMKSSVCLSRR